MNTKKIFYLVFFLVFLKTQAQSFDCKLKIKEYESQLLSKQMDLCFESWSEVKKNCGKEYPTVFANGLLILDYKITHSKTDEEREKWVRETIKLYDLYNNYFPLCAADFEISKAMLMYNNTVNAKQQMDEIFHLLENGFTNSPESITDIKAIDLYFNMCYDDYKSNPNTASTLNMVEKYIKINTILNRVEVNNPKETKDIKFIKLRIHDLLKSELNCNNLSSYYQKNLNQNINNENWLSNGLNLLSVECSSNPIFYSLAQAYYNKNCITNSAIFMGLASLKQKKMNDAERYYQEAESIEGNPQEKASIYFSFAKALSYIDKSKSKKYIQKAITFNPQLGIAYLFLAQLYADSADAICNSDLEKKSIYYLAIINLKKAAQLDSKLIDETHKRIEMYSKYSLTTDEINNEIRNGKPLHIGSWINESFTLSQE